MNDHTINIAQLVVEIAAFIFAVFRYLESKNKSWSILVLLLAIPLLYSFALVNKKVLTDGWILNNRTTTVSTPEPSVSPDVESAPKTTTISPPICPSSIAYEPVQGLPDGVFMEFQFGELSQDLLLQMQWQSDELWIDTDGWGGPVRNGDKVKWFAGKKDLGTGPFRLEIYSGDGRNLLATTPTFFIPKEPGQRR